MLAILNAWKLFVFVMKNLTPEPNYDTEFA